MPAARDGHVRHRTARPLPQPYHEDPPQEMRACWASKTMHPNIYIYVYIYKYINIMLHVCVSICVNIWVACCLGKNNFTLMMVMMVMMILPSMKDRTNVLRKII